MAVSSRDQMQTPDRTSGVTFAGSIKVGGPLPVSWSDALEILQRERLVKRVKCVGFHMQQLFEGIEFSDKRVLDIGGGFGMASLFAAALGAREVICLEPGSAGSSQVTQFGLRSAARSEVTRRIDFLDATLQAYLQTEPVPFDVIISNNSINHLDEPACVRLLEPEGRKTYQDIFKAIRQITQPGGRFIVSDCCRHNALEQFGVRKALAAEPMGRAHRGGRIRRHRSSMDIAELAGSTRRIRDEQPVDCMDRQWRIPSHVHGAVAASRLCNQAQCAPSPVGRLTVF